MAVLGGHFCARGGHFCAQGSHLWAWPGEIIFWAQGCLKGFWRILEAHLRFQGCYLEAQGDHFGP